MFCNMCQFRLYSVQRDVGWYSSLYGYFHRHTILGIILLHCLSRRIGACVHKYKILNYLNIVS